MQILSENNFELADDEIRHMTLLSGSMGDIEIAWDSTQDDAMRAVIEKKMAEGIRFFILKPMVGGILYRKTPLKTMADLKENRVKIGDEDLETMFAAGKIAFFRKQGEKIEMAPGKIDAKKASKSRTVGVPQFAGG